MRSGGNILVVSASQRRRRGKRRNMVVGGLFVAFFATIALGVLYRTAPSDPIRTAVSINADDDLTTGSIVFVPVLGNRCRNRLIDNATWRIRDNGFVDCRAALAQSANVRRLQWSSPRIDVIRDGFLRR